MLLLEYDGEWVAHYNQIKEKLLNALNGIKVSFEHIGSTSVPGLSAKPIIDIDIIYNETAEFEYIKKSLELVGYYHNGNQGVEGREVFKRNVKSEDETLDKITHHIYVCKYDCPELHRHILFRDYLRRHDIARDFYSNLKCEIALETRNDRKVYAAIKEVKASSFINYIIELAKVEISNPDKIG